MLDTRVVAAPNRGSMTRRMRLLSILSWHTWHAEYTACRPGLYPVPVVDACKPVERVPR